MLLREDGAQAFGGSIAGKQACSFGDIGTTSFFPAKPLGCYGDGGVTFTDNDDWAETIRSLQVHGKGTDKYDNIRPGRNSRLDTLQAAILLVKLKQFQEYELGQANQVAGWYNRLLGNGVEVPLIEDMFYSSRAQYTVICRRTGERDFLQQELKKAGIPSMVYCKRRMHE